MVGGEQWGEVIEGPVGESPWKAARWKHALIGQFAAAVERGDAATARARWERLLALLAPGTDEHRAVRAALDTL